MTQLSTRMAIPAYGDDELDLVVEYEYSPRSMELCIFGCDVDIRSERLPCWHLLTMRQRDSIEDQCRTDYTDRMEAVAEQKYEDRESSSLLGYSRIGRSNKY